MKLNILTVLWRTEYLKKWRIYMGCPIKLIKERLKKIIELENEWVNYIKS